MDIEWKVFWFLFWYGAIVWGIVGTLWAIKEKRTWLDGILPAALCLATWTAASYGFVAVVAWLGGWLWIIAFGGVLLAFVLAVLGALSGLLR